MIPTGTTATVTCTTDIMFSELFDNLGSIDGVGIDLVRISRFKAKLDDERFLSKVFHDSELDYAGMSVNRAAILAARWAAKEAVAKALGCGFGEELSWRDVVVAREPNGKPFIQLSEKAKLRHQHPEFLLSLSHDGEYAIAIALKQ